MLDQSGRVYMSPNNYRSTPETVIHHSSTNSSHSESLSGPAFQLNNYMLNHKVTALACRDQHILALESNGRVFSWGHNDHHQLGHPHPLPNHQPQLLPELNNIVSVHCGIASSGAIGQQGQCFLWGDNTS